MMKNAMNYSTVTMLAAILIVSAAVAGCLEQSATTSTLQQTSDLAGKQILMIVAPAGFQDDEFEIPYRYFASNGSTVTVASKNVAKATGVKGTVLDVDIELSEVNSADYDAVVFVGGPGVESYKLYEDPDCLRIAREANEQNRIVAAICLAPNILANAGILEGKSATVWATTSAYITDMGAHYTGAAVERDGNIITANGPGASQRFAEMIVDTLKGL